MRFAVLAVVVLGACGNKASSGGEGGGSNLHVVRAGAVGSGTIAAMHLEICDLGSRVVEDAACGSAMTPKDMKMTAKAFQGLLSTAADGRADPESLEDTCAQMVAVLDQQATKSGCALEMTDAERKLVRDRLASWYGKRTPVTPTGDAAADAVMTKIATVRDAMCACKDMACLGEVDKQIGAVGTLGSGSPQAARELGGKLYDDIGRCEKRIQMGIEP
jgi:hypothetical protein|nr:hypothetical protein [Kofleriaceae bacterium]